jgi:hypothetical protein
MKPLIPTRYWVPFLFVLAFYSLRESPLDLLVQMLFYKYLASHFSFISTRTTLVIRRPESG